MDGEGKKIKGSRAKGGGGLEKLFIFTRCSRRVFLCVIGVLDDVGGGVMFVRGYGSYGVNYSPI